MNRSRVDPLGVPTSSDYAAEGKRARHRSSSPPNAFDRWVVKELNAGLGDSPVHLQLWDAPRGRETPGKDLRVRIADRRALIMLLWNPALHFGDLYSAGRIEVSGDLASLLEHAYRYLQRNARAARWLARLRPLRTPDLLQSRRNIHHHYDIGNDFYRLWLDREALQYTCAYYADPSMTIEEAQVAKMDHVCRKLWLRPEERVVETGGGWGGFALFMARRYGVKVRSFNISREQVAYAREWAKRENLESRVEFVEDDYRNVTGRYDVFVSIGMLEHVGLGNYQELGRVIDRSLEPQGRGLIHTIGRDRPDRLNPWIDRRIFPGAYPPTLREMSAIFEPNALSILDVENLRLHYARTLQAWLERYEQSLETVRAMFDEPFVRAWRLYLAGSQAAFTSGGLQLFQVLFARSRVNEIPWTRTRIYERSARNQGE